MLPSSASPGDGQRGVLSADADPALAALKGHRGAPAGDIEALVDVVVAISELARREPDVLEAEVNPVVVGRTGATALDALVRRAGSTESIPLDD